MDDSNVGSVNFWLPGGYKPVTKRIHDGLSNMNNLVAMVEERSEIERKYASMLQGFASKWVGVINQGPLYNTMERSALGMCFEAEALAELRLQRRRKMLEEVLPDVKSFIKTEYETDLFGRLKEVRQYNDRFQRIQKPWVRRLREVKRRKKNYFSISQKLVNLNSDVIKLNQLEQSPEVKKKLDREILKLKDASERAIVLYEESLSDLQKYKSTYINAMKDIFQRCQDQEHARLRNLKTQFHRLHDCLDVSNDLGFQQIYVNYLADVQQGDEKSDLIWFENNRGPGMSFVGPSFESFQPKPKNKSKVTYPAQKQAKSAYFLSNPMNESNVAESKSVPNSSVSGLQTWKPAEIDNTPKESMINYKSNSRAASKNDPFDANVFKPFPKAKPPTVDLMDVNVNDVIDNSGSTSSLVKALYHYEATQFDELSLYPGMLLEHLGEASEPGWCKAKHDGKVGLVPRDYLEIVDG